MGLELTNRYHPGKPKGPENAIWTPVFPLVTRFDRIVIYFHYFKLGPVAIQKLVQAKTGYDACDVYPQHMIVEAVAAWFLYQGGWEMEPYKLGEYLAAGEWTMESGIGETDVAQLEADLRLSPEEIDLIRLYTVCFILTCARLV